jgi:hypothetical protein
MKGLLVNVESMKIYFAVNFVEREDRFDGGFHRLISMAIEMGGVKGSVLWLYIGAAAD